MPEYRQDLLTGRTVLIAQERASRPHHFDIDGTDYQQSCPFCEGNESLTPDEIFAFRPSCSKADSSGWTVRVVPNKYPAVARDDETYRNWHSFQQRFKDTVSVGQISPFPEEEAAHLIPGIGNHEVLIDSPRHVFSVTDMSDEETVNMFRMYRSRLRSLRQEGRWAYVQIFKNVGAAAGASIPHAHSQLIAMPFVPASFMRTMRRAKKYRSEIGSCFWCDMLASEIRSGRRVVEETNAFIALCPFVSRFAAEVEIYPKVHIPTFEDIGEQNEIVEFAHIVRRTVLRLEKAVYWMRNPLAYNFVLHSEPYVYEDSDEKGDDDQEDEKASSEGIEVLERDLRLGTNRPVPGNFHWHLSILPSLARAAGFEWGTGLHINPIPPETAAKSLRDIVIP